MICLSLSWYVQRLSIFLACEDWTQIVRSYTTPKDGILRRRGRLLVLLPIMKRFNLKWVTANAGDDDTSCRCHGLWYVFRSVASTALVIVAVGNTALRRSWRKAEVIGCTRCCDIALTTIDRATTPSVAAVAVAVQVTTACVVELSRYSRRQHGFEREEAQKMRRHSISLLFATIVAAACDTARGTSKTADETDSDRLEGLFEQKVESVSALTKPASPRYIPQ